MNRKIKSTYDEYVESLSPKRKKEFYQGLRELALSELFLAKLEKDEESIHKLEKIVSSAQIHIQSR